MKEFTNFEDVKYFYYCHSILGADPITRRLFKSLSAIVIVILSAWFFYPVFGITLAQLKPTALLSFIL